MRQVVAVERDVDDADGDGDALDLAQERGEAAGDVVAAAAQADEDDVGQALVLLEDLVGDAHEGAPDAGLVEYFRFRVHGRFLTSRDELKDPGTAADHTAAGRGCQAL